MHCTYLSAVAIEAHGVYANAAAGLLVMVLLEVFTKEAGA